jgi:single-strand DNA-binding protein
MKKIENNFAVTGFVGKDAEIRQFSTASVARFSLAVGCTKYGAKIA